MQAILLYSLALFCCCLAIHILVCRILKVRRYALWLSLIFLIGPAIGLALGLSGVLARTLRGIELPQLLLIYLLHFSLSISYMLLYTGIIGFSPSIAILQHVAASMPTGLPRDQLAPIWFTDEMLSGARHNNLKQMDLISESGGVLRLHTRGRFIASCFLVFRRLLSLPDIAKG